MNAKHQATDTSLDAHSLETLYGFAWMLLDNQRVADAMNVFRVIVRFAPTDERGWLGLGNCHELRDEEEIAAELFGAGSLATSPPSSRCLLALARIARRRGDAALSAESLEEAEERAAALGDATLCDLVASERSRQ